MTLMSHYSDSWP